MWTGPRTGAVIDLGERGDGQTLEIAMVLSPAGLGQVPALELSMFETLRATEASELSREQAAPPISGQGPPEPEPPSAIV
jgi:hypothetical protein